MWKTVFAFRICIARCEFLRCQVAHRTVRAHLVVIDPPAFNGFACIVQGEKPVFVQAFLAELSMEAFDVAVLHWPARRDEVQRSEHSAAARNAPTASRLACWLTTFLIAPP